MGGERQENMVKTTPTLKIEPHPGPGSQNGRIGLAGERLKEIFGDRMTTSGAICRHHGAGEGFREVSPPDMVVFPKTTEEVSRALAICNTLSVPVVPFGAGTSLEGQVNATEGGVCLDLSEMNTILEINENSLDCKVQAGVKRKQLNLELRHSGLFFPPDPGADATLGGMASTRASGTNAVLYGTMRELVLGLTVVMPDGTIVRTGGRARKSSTGYDLTRLFVGSEGTLGVITEIQVRLFGRPEKMVSAVCQFPNLKNAVEAVILAIQLGIPLARIELLDQLQMQACKDYSKLENLEALPTLFLEFHGSGGAISDHVLRMQEVTGEAGGGDFRWATTQELRNQLWRARHDAYYAALALKPGCKGLATDACVPISALADCIMEARDAAVESGLTCPIVGHVGDGNFHLLILFDPARKTEKAKAEALALAVSRMALKYGGTASGEHGVGLKKLPLMTEEHGTGVAVMRAIKKALDPNNIMNPGKTIPLENEFTTGNGQ